MPEVFPSSKTLLIFTGGPGTGKSGTAARFLDYLNHPDITKISYDSVKEKEWDRFGFDNVQQKDRLNAWALEEFYLMVQHEMWKGSTILIEYPFYQRHRDKLKELIDEYAYDAVTIYLYTDLKTSYERGIRRDSHDRRHPGHLLNAYHKETFEPSMLKDKSLSSSLTFDEFKAQISKKNYDIQLGLTIPVDVTSFSNIHYDDICRQITTYEQHLHADQNAS